jgi:hypothetical protein
VSAITNSSATISFTTNIKANSTIYYGTTASNLNLSKPSGTSTTAHSAALSALPALTKIYYRIDAIVGSTTSSSSGNFTTN